MKKGKEWLKNEVSELYPSYDEMYVSPDYETVAKTETISKVLELINQLDEPEVKQLDKKIKELESYNDELIRDNNLLRNTLDNQKVLSEEWIESNTSPVDDEGRLYIWKRDLQNLLVPKQELPVIPQFVVGFIRATKASNSLRVAFEYISQRKIDNYDDELALWIEEGNSELFASAWIDGYEVEEEQKYEVVLPTGQLNAILVAHADGTGYFFSGEHRNDSWYKSHLTEQEIKAIDKRFWVFAEEIK